LAGLTSTKLMVVEKQRSRRSAALKY
jgi:hypothetical protein